VGVTDLRYAGPFALYFNRHADAPRVWCVAALDRGWEINVEGFECEVRLTSRYSPIPQLPDHSGPPAAWLEGNGVVSVGPDGWALIT
jgi:hypothetical protein